MILFIPAGCKSQLPPLTITADSDPDLHQIQLALKEAIDRTRQDPDYTWHNGWWGNMAINWWEAWGVTQRGLCYHWQEHIHTEIAPTLARIGWRSAGLAVNENHSGEHHAVIVYNPRIIREDHLLARPHAAFVLDAWRRGEPDVYRMSDWLYNQREIRAPARLETITPHAPVQRPTNDNEPATTSD